MWEKLCNHKWRAILCALVAIAGIVVGGVFFNIFKYSWWYFNRWYYAENLFTGGFSLFVSFVVCALLFYLCLVVCNLHTSFRFLSYIVLFVACFYCGANTTAAIVCWSVWGILFALLATLPEAMGFYLATFYACCEYPECRSFKEAICDLRPCLYVLLISQLAKIIGFFVILRVLTAII